MSVTIHTADTNDPAVARMIAAHIADGDAAYPAQSNHHLTVADHIDSHVALYAAWDDGVCHGILGLMRLSDSAAEIKSMHVLSSARGRGTGAALLAHILHVARDRGFERLYLETGSREASAAARRLYEACGFDYCPPFGTYTLDPESTFMVRDI